MGDLFSFAYWTRDCRSMALRQLGHPHLFQEELQALSRRSRYAWSTVRDGLFDLSTEACVSDLVARYGRSWQSCRTIATNASLRTAWNHLTERRGGFEQLFVLCVGCHSRQVGAVRFAGLCFGPSSRSRLVPIAHVHLPHKSRRVLRSTLSKDQATLMALC